VIWELFSDLVLLVLTMPGSGPVLRLQGFSKAQRRVLTMLGLDQAVLVGRNKSRAPSG